MFAKLFGRGDATSTQPTDRTAALGKKAADEQPTKGDIRPKDKKSGRSGRSGSF